MGLINIAKNLILRKKTFFRTLISVILSIHKSYVAIRYIIGENHFSFTTVFFRNSNFGGSGPLAGELPELWRIRIRNTASYPLLIG